MANINWGSIEKKIQTAMNSNAVRKRMDKAIDTKVASGVNGNGMPLDMAAAKFIEVLQNEIQSHAVPEGSELVKDGGLGPTAVVALTKMEHNSPYKIGDNRYRIDIWFTNDLDRPSLDPNKYGGIDNLAALLNSGYTAGHTVYGVWKGHNNDERISSLVSRGGAHFIEQAIRDYMGNYASEYGVIDIECADIYDIRNK